MESICHQLRMRGANLRDKLPVLVPQQGDPDRGGEGG